MFRPGAIRKIEVRNFVTYSYVELYLGANLNMILGPNGTGKSTIVAAIILGLGGNPKVVGRGTKVSEYVKHNCEVATINLYLQGDDENKRVKVTREFDNCERTTWKLNDKKVKVNEIMECINKFNIQVDNLCQFLPQDRVQDFAKLNKQQLLKETQQALCRFDLVEKQSALIENRDQLKQLEEVVSKGQKKIKEHQELNTRLEGRVHNFKKKKEYTEKLEHIERKVAWVKYQDLRKQVSEVKGDMVKAQEVCTKYRDELKPLNREINQGKAKITELLQGSNKTNQLVKNSQKLIEATLQQIQTTNQSINKLKSNLDINLAEIEQYDKEIENEGHKLEEMKLQKREMQKRYESEGSNQSLSNELNKYTQLQKKISDTKDEILQRKQEDNLNMRALQNESCRLENVKQMRLQHLQKIKPEIHQAVSWVRNNKHLFEGQVYDPIMLELNVLDNKNAKYLENIIAFRDIIAFTCTSKADMSLLIKSLRRQQNIPVNVIHSEYTETSHYKPREPIENLRKYGFYTYMNNLFTAPAPIMNYLCKTYNLHNIPLGDDTTDKNYSDVPQQFKLFFSSKSRYYINVSKITNNKTVRQVEVTARNNLSFSLDILKLNQLKAQISEIQERLAKYNSDNEALDKQYNTLSEKINTIQRSLKDAQQQKQNLLNIQTRIDILSKKINKMKQLKKSPDELKMECNRKQKQLFDSIPEKHNIVQIELAKMVEQERNGVLTQKRIEMIRKQLAVLENTLEEKRRLFQEAEDTKNKIEERYSDILNEAKVSLKKAKDLSNQFTPADNGFSIYIEQYNALSSKLDDLENAKQQIMSRIACLNVADDGEMQEYENRQKEIEKLNNDLENHESNHRKISTKIAKLQKEWLIPLEELIGEINKKFAAAFEKLGCAGGVSICTGTDENDFSNYGISIKVTYRNGEPLQELNASTQSGGERAVATAAYMLSLQTLTPVPFRCVDEINQGMDANNERRIFDLIVHSTCYESSSQYLLITPKLIPNLTYPPNIRVHFVHNGPFVTKDKKWAFSKLCNMDGY